MAAGRFKDKVERALVAVRKCLDATRHPCFPADVAHKYEDKYQLAEFTGNVAVAALLNALDALGMDGTAVSQAQGWASDGKAVTLRFESTERCAFVRETERKESGPEHVTTSEKKGRSSSKVVTTVKEYWYSVEAHHTLSVYAGADPSDPGSRKVLKERTGGTEVLCTTKKAPRPETSVKPPVEAELTWMLRQLAADGTVGFAIDREDDKCRTPRHNPAADELLKFSGQLAAFARRVSAYIQKALFALPVLPGEPPHDPSAASRPDAVFVPVLPLLFEERTETADGHAGGQTDGGGGGGGTSGRQIVAQSSELLMQPRDADALLTEQRRSFAEQSKAVADTFPGSDSRGAASYTEGLLVLAMNHVSEIGIRLEECFDYFHRMLEAQLFAAIGKEVGPHDFDAYMAYHQGLVFTPTYAPKPFCHAVRRPEHYPEGVVAIEGTRAPNEPILTLSRAIPADRAGAVTVRLGAATEVQLTGPQHLHGYVANAFAGNQGRALQLVARARQFSCFMLVVGRMLPSGGLDPEHAIIVQNKDDLKIPLMLEQLPTPKAFRDAIESLSPEQQRFAKAYRAMQLSGTVFGVGIIQLKPQLERLLGLPDGALTKEIKLTQQLLKLFIEHQIPSDLLRFDGEPDSSQREKLASVQGHVDAIFAMIQSEREEELKAREEEAKFEHPDVSRLADAMNFREVMERSKEGGMPVSRGGRRQRSMAADVAVYGAVAGVAKKKALPIAQRMESSIQQPVSAFQDDARTTVATGGAVSSDSASSETGTMTTADDTGAPASSEGGFNYTSIPATLDQRFEQFDPDAALHACTVKLGPTWDRSQQRKLLAKPSKSTLRDSLQKEEKGRAFDLLDALSRSGTLPIECSELHVIIAAIHCFDKTVVQTVVADNVNPIEKVERSALILAATIHDVEPSTLVQPHQLGRLEQYSAPALLGAEHHA